MTCTRISPRLHELTSLLIQCASLALGVSAALAAEGAKRSFNVPAGTVERALRVFAEQAGIQLIFAPGVTDGIRTKGVKGEFTIADASDRLLVGTKLRLTPDKKTGVYGLARVTPEESVPPPPSRINGAAREPL